MKENFDIVDLPENKEESIDDTEVSFASVDKILEENKNLRSAIEELNAQLKKLDPSYQNEIIERLLEENESLKYDKVTGLRRRDFVEDIVSRYLNKIKEHKENNFERRKEDEGFEDLSVIFIDLDHFKSINDTFGHDVGDEVLRKVSQTLKDSVRENDVICRWGGEEIVAVLFGAGEKDAVNKAKTLKKSIEDLSFSNDKLKVTASMGVSSSEYDLELDSLIKKADLAVYHAKGRGRNLVVGYSELES